MKRNKEETKKLTLGFAREIEKRGKPRVFGLVGDLGSGKTAFTQFFAQALGVKERVISPSFVIARRYPFSLNKTKWMLHHVDLYRLAEGDVETVGLEDLISQPNSITVIEWAEKAKDLLPKETVWLSFKYLSEDKRKITEITPPRCYT